MTEPPTWPERESLQGQDLDFKRDLSDVRVVFMTHYIPLYQVRVLQSIARQVGDFHVLLSTPIEPNRDFKPDWSGLDVRVQKNITLRRHWKHTSGFTDDLYVHFPVDTQEQLRHLNPDVVMSLELGARSFGASRYCRRHPKSKLILCTYMSEHTEQGRGWMRSAVRKRLTRCADAITYNGPSCLRYLRDTLLVPGPKLFPMPYAADDRNVAPECDDIAESMPGEPERGRLLCVGQLSERKGVVPLARQLAQYCRRNPSKKITCTFAGEGNKREVLEAFETPANLTFDLLGNVPACKLPGLMRSHSALIAPTLADEWLLVINEAFHAGTPVLGSIYAQAVTTMVRDGVNGWQYDPLQEQSLHKILDAYFATEKDRYAQMRISASDGIANRTPQWAASGALDAIRALTIDPWRIPDPVHRATQVRDRFAAV